jgi:hypothetical protein
MRTFIEIRVMEDWMSEQYGSSLGEPLLVDGVAFVRRIVLELGDPRLADLKARLERDQKKPAVGVRREYTHLELADAERFQLMINACFHQEACGEDYGTEYDDSNACAKCGAGRVQRSPLRLDLSLAPVDVQICRTIALNEVAVSQRLVDLMQLHKVSGYEVREIEHRGKRTPRGRWYQLIVTGNAGPTVPPTHFGLSYLEEDAQGTHTCQEHLLSGLHILSEAFLARNNIENVDLAHTSNRTGIRSGVLMPTPLIVVSPRLYRILSESRLHGCEFEIAHVLG